MRRFENRMRPSATLPLSALKTRAEKLTAQQGTALKLATIQHQPRQISISEVNANEAQRTGVLVDQRLDVFTPERCVFDLKMCLPFAHAWLPTDWIGEAVYRHHA
ncbi:hypothetical protein [Pseudomonas nunensis]|uniref:hypothetical protein n=1 Tax=Pseudomonas nunensis TaxID=2961896 RepID=UPI00210C642F|nr:hypothetical protein [Pseudomonas nunensis]